jgi:hypothetical protein
MAQSFEQQLAQLRSDMARNAHDARMSIAQMPTFTLPPTVHQIAVTQPLTQQTQSSIEQQLAQLRWEVAERRHAAPPLAQPPAQQAQPSFEQQLAQLRQDAAERHHAAMLAITRR